MIQKKSVPIIGHAKTHDKDTTSDADAQKFMRSLEATFAKAEALKNSVPEQVGMFRGKSANDTLREASTRPDPKPLWQTLWYEGEVSCLFADSNVGKSLYAVQIAAEIAKTQRVLYLDFELSDKQFQLRYTDKDSGALFRFPANLYRYEINPEEIAAGDFEGRLIEDVEHLLLQTSAKVIIIDNLTYLCLDAEKGAEAGELMLRLIRLKRKHGLSMLVIAHTPKRNLIAPITQNDLAGSKKLFNFFDSVFSIGRSVQGNDIRYIKQLKVRYGAFTHSANNVIECRIEQRGSMTQFVFTGYGTEAAHLAAREDVRQMQAKQAKELHAQGYTQRDIAARVGVSLGTVNGMIKER